MEGLKRICTPMKSIDESLFDAKGLQQISEIIGNSSVVGLGEATHGTAEFTKARFEIFKHLVQNKGFSIFTIEASFADCEDINRYILGVENTLSINGLQTLGFPWCTQEFSELIEWMREYNKKANNKVQFFGFNLPYSTAKVRNIFARKGIYVDAMPEINAGPLFEKSMSLMRQACESSDHKEIIQTQDDMKKSSEYKKEIDTISQLCSLLEKNEHRFSKRRYLWNRQLLRTLEQSVNSLVSIGFRESAMAENILWIRSQNPTAKMVVWGHNGHLHKISLATKRMGDFLDEKLCNEYCVLALTTYQGTYTAVRHDSGLLNRKLIIREPSNDRIEHHLHQLGQSMLLVDLRQSQSLQLFPDQPKLLNIDAYEESERSVMPYAINTNPFNGIIYIDSTTATTSYSFNPLSVFLNCKPIQQFNEKLKSNNPHVLFDKGSTVKENLRDLCFFSSKPIGDDEAKLERYDSARSNTARR